MTRRLPIPGGDLPPIVWRKIIDDQRDEESWKRSPHVDDIPGQNPFDIREDTDETPKRDLPYGYTIDFKRAIAEALGSEQL